MYAGVEVSHSYVIIFVYLHITAQINQSEEAFYKGTVFCSRT